MIKKLEGYLFLTNTPQVEWNELSEDKNDYIGLGVTAITKLNRVHVFSDQSMNWSEYHPEIKGWVFPKYLPSAMLKYFRENQVCKIRIHNIMFNLHLSQGIYFEFNKFKPIELGIFQKAYKKLNGS